MSSSRIHGNKRRSTLEDVWSLHKDEISLTKGMVWTGSQQKWSEMCVLRDAEIQTSLEAREAQEWISTAAENPWPSSQPSPQLPDHSWCTGHRYRARAGSLFPALTAHLATVWNTQPQAKLSNTSTWKKITHMKAKKGLFFKMVWPINVSAAELQTLQSFRHRSGYFLGFRKPTKVKLKAQTIL